LIHLPWDWGITDTSKFRSWYKATEGVQLSVFVCVFEDQYGNTSIVFCYVSHTVPISYFF